MKKEIPRIPLPPNRNCKLASFVRRRISPAPRESGGGALGAASLYGPCRRRGIFTPLSRGLFLSTLKYLSYVRRAELFISRGGGATKRGIASSSLSVKNPTSGGLLWTRLALSSTVRRSRYVIKSVLALGYSCWRRADSPLKGSRPGSRELLLYCGILKRRATSIADNRIYQRAFFRWECIMRVGKSAEREPGSENGVIKSHSPPLWLMVMRRRINGVTRYHAEPRERTVSALLRL